MKNHEVLSQASAILVSDQSADGKGVSVLTSAHVVAPWAFRCKIFIEPFKQYREAYIDVI